MQSALAALESVYFTLQTNLNMILAATPADQRDVVMSKYVQARANYWACIGKSFHDDDPALISLVNEMAPVEEFLEDANKELGNIAKVIGYVTKAADLGAQIAAKVIAV